MGFEVELILYCDNDCGESEDYTGDDIDPADGLDIDEMPTGWVKDYDNGDTIFKYLCAKCFKQFEEEKG